MRSSFISSETGASIFVFVLLASPSPRAAEHACPTGPSSPRCERRAHALHFHAPAPTPFDALIDVPLAKFRVSAVDPGVADAAVLLDGFAEREVAGRADFEDGVVARVEGEGEASRVGFARGWGHDAGIQDGDDGAGDKFPEARVGGREEVEVDGPFEVGESHDHVFPVRVGL